MFDIGEKTGHKVDANTVSQSMRKARNLDGSCMFDSSEYLAQKQIKSFFSRLAKKRREGNSEGNSEDKSEDKMDEDQEENEEAWAEEEQLQELRNSVIKEVGLVYPITFESHNLCEIYSDNKLPKLSIKMLSDICAFFDLDTTAFKGTRRKPFIDLLKMEVIGNCSCKRYVVNTVSFI
jgi:hypothetical protein